MAPLNIDAERVPLLWLLLIVAVAVGTRFYGLTGPSLWLDEGYSIRIVVMERDNFLRPLMVDVHPPLYFLMLLGWTEIFGTGEWALRSLSAVLGVLTVPVMFGIGRLFGGRRVGLAAALLLALSPIHVQYSAEVRMYSLLVLAAAIGIWGALRFALSPADPRAARQGSIAFAVGAVLCPLSQVTGLFVLPPLTLLMLLGWWQAGRPRAALRAALWAHLAVFLFLVAYTPLLLRLSANAVQYMDWMPRPSPRFFAEVVGALLAQKLSELVPLAVTGAVALFVSGVALMGVWLVRRDAVRLGFALLVGALPFAMTIAVSLIAQPVFITRIHLWALLPLYALVALALIAAPLRALRQGMAAGLLLVSLAGLYAYHTLPGRPDWRGVAQTIGAGFEPGDKVLVPPLTGSEPVLAYYAPLIAGTTVSVGSEADIPPLLDATAGRRVWIVSAPWHDRVDAEVVGRALSRQHTAEAVQQFRLITLQLWQPN